MFRFTIRDVLLVMVIVGLAVGWWVDHQRQDRTIEAIRGWWSDHLEREHSSNPNDYKRFFQRDGPPF
jgi:hypothetical protein